MDKLKLAKMAGSFVVSTGVGTVLKNAVNMTTPANLNPIQTMSVKVGTIVIGAYLSEHVLDYLEESIDKAWTGIKEAKAEAEEQLKEQ